MGGGCGFRKRAYGGIAGDDADAPKADVPLIKRFDTF